MHVQLNRVRGKALCLKPPLVPYTFVLSVQTTKVLARLFGCTGSPEPSLFAYLILPFCHRLDHLCFVKTPVLANWKNPVVI